MCMMRGDINAKSLITDSGHVYRQGFFLTLTCRMWHVRVGARRVATEGSGLLQAH